MQRFFGIIAMAALLIVSAGCDKEEHNILIVRLSKYPDGLPADNAYIQKAIKKGGMIELSADKVKEIDPDWCEKYDVTNKDGKYLVYPMVLNWVASRGWKLQTVFCINLNADNKEFFFVK